VRTVDSVLGDRPFGKASQPFLQPWRLACARHPATRPSKGCDYLGKGRAVQQIPLQSTKIISILRYAQGGDHEWDGRVACLYLCGCFRHTIDLADCKTYRYHRMGLSRANLWREQYPQAKKREAAPNQAPCEFPT